MKNPFRSRGADDDGDDHDDYGSDDLDVYGGHFDEGDMELGQGLIRDPVDLDDEVDEILAREGYLEAGTTREHKALDLPPADLPPADLPPAGRVPIDDPAFDDTAFDDQPSYDGPAFDDQPSYDGPAFDDDQFADDPVLDDAPGFDTDAGLDDEGFDDEAYDDQAFGDDPAFGEDPAFDDGEPADLRAHIPAPLSAAARGSATIAASTSGVVDEDSIASHPIGEGASETSGMGRALAERVSDQAGKSFVGQRSAWSYLGVLTGLFGVLVVFGYGCSDQRTEELATREVGEVMANGEPSRLVFNVDGDIIAIQGSVPDEAARTQILDAVKADYGAENVVDELVVDEGTTLEEGTIRLVGSALTDDERPKALQDRVSADFGLANRGFEVTFAETVLAPVLAELALTNTGVSVAGLLPDDQSLTDLVALVSEVWTGLPVDTTALGVGETTWTDGLIRVIGSSSSNDLRVGQFTSLVPDRIATLVVVDTSELVISDDSERVAEVQQTITDLVLAQPILFAPESANIDPASDPVLAEVVTLLTEIPTVQFEVVGHTDTLGDDQENQVLSEDRALAVVTRLIDLGVDPNRMTSRGEGESKPIADNNTDAGRAANRRIEFVLIGTSTN